MIDPNEELQNQIENGAAGEGLDADAFKKVFEALRQEPDFQLSSNFADSVISRIQTGKVTSGDMIWFFIGIFSFGIAAIVTVIITGFKFNFGALKFIGNYAGLVVFGIAFIILLQWLDKKFIKKLSL